MRYGLIELILKLSVKTNAQLSTVTLSENYYPSFIMGHLSTMDLD